jgi:hypothetical protein
MGKLQIPHDAFVFVGDGRKRCSYAMPVTKSFPT